MNKSAREMFEETILKQKELQENYKKAKILRKQKEVIDEIKKICNNVPHDWSVCGIEVIHKIEKVLEEVD